VLPACLVLIGAFLAVSKVVGERVTEGVRQSLRREQTERARSEKLHDRQTAQLLAILAGNEDLRAALAGGGDTWVPVLRSMSAVSQSDVIAVWNEQGQALGGMQWQKPEPVRLAAGAIPAGGMSAGPSGLAPIGSTYYRWIPAPVTANGIRLGTVALGQRLDLASYGSLAALIREGTVVASSLQGVQAADLQSAVGQCGDATRECQLQLAGETYISIPLTQADTGGGLMVRRFQSVEDESGTLIGGVRLVFYVAAAVSLLTGLLLAALLSRSVVHPITALVEQLRSAERTGLLVPNFHDKSHTQEVNQLAQSFNRAASSAVESRKRLDGAYVQFVEILAQALDARDVYTAGHSRRVSEYSCAIGDQLRLPEDQIHVLRVGALLHDIGKVGIPDEILQKPGPLTVEEFEILKQHPVIGKRILEPCEGFQAFLPIVELHHENHDGTGYPWHLADTAIPVEARIVHVADAYDAMTTDRPYRRGMSHDVAIQRLRTMAGTQFDPDVVRAVEQMCSRGWRGSDDRRATPSDASVEALVRALRPEDKSSTRTLELEDHQRV